MTDITTQREAPLPKAMPMLLSFVAGYVDSYTYLALFGLFAAQVTGSFVIAGAELGSRLIKSTIRDWQRGRQKTGSFVPACRIALQFA